MSLQKERGESTRRKWFSRFSRERLDLSVSVEETLLDEGMVRQQDLLDSEGASVHADSLQTSQHAKVISPRLTMPSSPMPVVRAQPAANKLSSRPTKIRLETASVPVVEQWKEQVVDKADQGNAAAITRPNTGYEETGRATTSDMQSLDISASIPTTPEVGSPVLDFYRLEMRDSSMRLPAIAISEEPLHISQRKRETLSGAGVFEAGQRDITLENTLITDTTLVLVMLTSNPGPAVVQYVSLQPAVGFTIHLSASATMKTSFNYVILLGELF